MPRIMHIAFTVYPVKDMKKARAFYEDVLGLTVTNQYESFWVEYVLDSTCFALMDVTASNAPVKPSADGGSIAFEVDDLDGYMTLMRERGVTVLGDVIEAPGCRQVYVADPDGNAVGFHQKGPGRA